MSYLEYVEQLMDQGYSEETACREADSYFNPEGYNAGDYET